MLFRRRNAPSLLERFFIALWPRRSWRRSVRYLYLRLRRLPESPYSIAMGFACGVFAVATPFLGLQMVMAAVAAWVLRGSIVASAIGSFWGNPFTYPILWLSSYELGNVILGTGGGPGAVVDFQSRADAVYEGVANLSPLRIVSSLETLWPILKPMAVGSLPIGFITGAVSYIILWRLIDAARRERRVRLNLRAA